MLDLDHTLLHTTLPRPGQEEAIARVLEMSAAHTLDGRPDVHELIVSGHRCRPVR